MKRFYGFSSDSQSHFLLFFVIQPFASSSMIRDLVCCKRKSMRKPWTSSQLWKWWVHLVIVPPFDSRVYCRRGHLWWSVRHWHWQLQFIRFTSVEVSLNGSQWCSHSDWLLLYVLGFTEPPYIVHRQEMISGGSQRSHRARFKNEQKTLKTTALKNFIETDGLTSNLFLFCRFIVDDEHIWRDDGHAGAHPQET